MVVLTHTQRFGLNVRRR